MGGTDVISAIVTHPLPRLFISPSKGLFNNSMPIYIHLEGGSGTEDIIRYIYECWNITKEQLGVMRNVDLL